MNVLSLLDRVADTNLWFAAGIVAVYLMWMVAKRLLRSADVANALPRVLASIDLLLTPLALICLGSLVKTGLNWLDVADLGENVRFLVHLGVFLSIAWFIARFLQLWILSRSRYDVGTYQPGLERGLLFGSVLFIGLICIPRGRGLFDHRSLRFHRCGRGDRRLCHAADPGRSLFRHRIEPRASLSARRLD